MKYNNLYKQELVKRYNEGDSVALLCNETGVSRSTLYSWITTLKLIDSTCDESITMREYKKLTQRVQKLESIIRILKIVKCTVSSPLREKLSAMESLHAEFSRYILCEALEVPRGTFYNHIYRNKRDKSTYAENRKVLCDAIKEVYEDSGQVFGSGKINAVLHERGYKTSEKMVTALMREMNICSISPASKREYLK